MYFGARVDSHPSELKFQEIVHDMREEVTVCVKGLFCDVLSRCRPLIATDTG